MFRSSPRWRLEDSPEKERGLQAVMGTEGIAVVIVSSSSSKVDNQHTLCRNGPIRMEHLQSELAPVERQMMALWPRLA
jgi:hypothetical protein